MKLYEVNRQIEDLLYQLEPDPETGEIPANEEEIIDQIPLQKRPCAVCQSGDRPGVLREPLCQDLRRPGLCP